MKIANRDAREMVQKEHPFEGNNLFAQFHTDGDVMWYAVYSYGTHWPLFIKAEGVWFENEDKYSPTTSKHKSQCHPHTTTFPLSTQWMKVLAEQGYVALAKMRITEGVTWL